MPLQLPNLDDRRFNDLTTEALARIPTYSPEWTNHNPSDPGITLVELFAYLTDMLLYRLNRITDDNTRKFLKMLNGPDWVEPRNADLREEIRTTVLGIRERYRAVTKDDYKFLATESFNQWLIHTLQSPNDPAVRASLASVNLVARAHCVPQRNLDAGTEADRLKLKPEHVSVVIVPAPERPNLNPPPQTVPAPNNSPSPQPSKDQLSALFSFLDERRMLTTKLHVTGPFYAHVSAQLVIARNSDALDADLNSAITASLTSLLNPLSSDQGEGWPFGRDVFVSEVYETLERIPGIDFITDVMLGSSCTPRDDKCVVADPNWHREGDLVGLRIQEHHLPVFDQANTTIVIAANDAFIAVNLSVSAKAQANTDLASLKRSIKSTVRSIFHPGLGGPGPTTAQPTNIFVSDVRVAIKNLAGVDPGVDPTVTVNCTPSDTLQNDKDRGQFIHVEPGKVVDWRVSTQLS
jgi:hypothetical protein